MMTYKQVKFIEGLAKDLEARGINVVDFPDYVEYLNKGEYGTTTKQASELIGMLKEELESAPAAEVKAVNTDHIKKGLVTLITKKRKNKQATEMAIRPIVGGFLNRVTMNNVTDEQLLEMESILREAKYIK